MNAFTNALTRRRSAWPFCLVMSLLFLLAGWQRPDNRIPYLMVGVVFGMLAARLRSVSRSSL